MENLNAITGFFAQIWQIMTINHPVIGIPFSVIYLGAFAIGFGIIILRPLLGIGAGAIGDITGSAKRIRDNRIARVNEKYKNSYEYYEAKNRQQESYYKRYMNKYHNGGKL